MAQGQGRRIIKRGLAGFVSWNNVSAVLARIVALGLGSYLAYCEVVGTYEYYLADQGGKVNYIVQATVGITLVTALAPMFIAMAFRARHWVIGTLLLLALPIAILLVFGAAVSRTGGNADTAEQTRVKIVEAKALAKKTETEATDALANATAEAKKECNTGSGTGRGGKCLLAEEKRDTAQARLDKARAAVVDAGVPKRDPWAMRIAEISKGRISEETVRIYWPVTVPLVVSIFAGLLLAFGAHLDLTPRAKPGQGEVVEPKPPPFKKEPLRLVASNNNLMGTILDFMCVDFERCAGSRVSETDAYRAYAERHPMPVTPEEFVPVFDRACAECGIQRESVGGKVYLMDVKILEPSERKHG